ncbi:MAG: class I SAM-dependent methyltransferase, partial [Bilophila sp.]
EKLFTLVPKNPTFVEIGHGDGSFLQGLKACAPAGSTARCIGFDPHGAVCSEPGMELLADLFLPEQHIPKLHPDMVLARHVLEHLDNPLEFLQHIAVTATLYGKPIRAYFEVPCVDRVLETGRTTDFYYEHRSQFTSDSFATMLRKSGGTIIELGHSYQSEVVYAFVLFDVSADMQAVLRTASVYREKTAASLGTIRAQLSELAKRVALGEVVAIWGGVGKAAAFINRYRCSASDFALVVDSDKEKINSYVPGMGQKILFRDTLRTTPPDVIIIPAQWRARDILLEIRTSGIAFRQLLIEHNGRLIDFLSDVHPY